MSYRYTGPLPEEDGLLVDGDDLSPIVHSTADLEFTRYLPASAALQLRPQGEVLVLEPRGGLDGKLYCWGDEPAGETPEQARRFANIWQGEFPNHNTQADGFVRTRALRRC